jgi:hypothetical protein
MQSIATNYMPEVASDSPYDFKKMLESSPLELELELIQAHVAQKPMFRVEVSTRVLGWATDTESLISAKPGEG